MGDSKTEPTRAEDRACRSIIEQSSDQPDQLTIFAATNQRNADASAWITATEDSFVYLSLVR